MRCTLTGFALAMLLWAAPVQAASIAEVRDRDHGCILSLSGEIEAGDTDKLKAKLSELLKSGRHSQALYETVEDGPGAVGVQRPSSICLNSAGGSFVEAVKMMDYVYGRLGTVVQDKAQCLSACALIFMAGSHSTETDAGILQRRFLHVGGKLGFHAPSLAVGQGNYSEAEVNRAYRISVAATGKLLRRLGDIKFDTSLLAKMYATPAEEMFYIDSVRAAARWRIDILGVPRPARITDGMADNACVNAYSTLYDYYTTDPDRWNASGVGFIRDPVSRTTSFGRPAWNVAGFGSEGAGTCQLTDSPGEPFANEGAERLIAQSYFGHAHAREALPPLPFARVRNFMLYPGGVPLAALAPGAVVTSAGQCHVFRNEERIDGDPCTLQASTAASGAGVFAYVWPSGAKTVVEIAGRSVKINGKDAFGSFASSYGLTGDCYYNTGSKNTFCFEPG